MKIVICEDEQMYQKEIVEAIGRWKAASDHADIELSLFSSSEDLLDHLEHGAEVDLLFVDIQIPGEMNGVELARKIREAHLDMTIVFCTNYSEYVFEGYTVNALRYLKKPVAQEDINYCCSYVYNRLAIRNDHALTLFSAGKRYVLRHIEIRCIEARLRSLLFYTTLSDEPLRINAKLTDIQSSLPENLFILCHRSYIVNIAHVRMLTRTDCTLSNDMSIPISRTYSAEVEEIFDRYHQGGHVKYDLDGV